MVFWGLSLKLREVRQYSAPGTFMLVEHTVWHVATSSSQSYSLLQKHLQNHDLQCSCPLSWKDYYSTVSTFRERPSFITKQLSENVLHMWFMAKIIFFLSTALIQYLFQLLMVSMDFNQVLKLLSTFLKAVLYCHYFPSVSIAYLKVRKIFWWIPAGKVKSYIPMYLLLTKWKWMGNHLVEKVA